MKLVRVYIVGIEGVSAVSIKAKPFTSLCLGYGVWADQFGDAQEAAEK